MAQSLDQIASLVDALQRRVDTLEAACDRLQRQASSVAVGNRPSARAVPRDGFSVQMAQMHAVNDFHQLEQIKLMAAEPDLLAGVRAQRATLNAYLEERGLPPRPDPYHELP